MLGSPSQPATFSPWLPIPGRRRAGFEQCLFRRSDAIDCVQFQYTSPQQTWVTLPGTFASMAQADNAATLATLAVDGELRMWSVGLGTLAHADTALTGY